MTFDTDEATVFQIRRRLVGPLIPQLTSAARARTDRYGHFDGRLATRRGPPERKAALSRLAARPLGIRFGVSLPMPRSSPRRLQFLAQFLVFVPQPIILFLG